MKLIMSRIKNSPLLSCLLVFGLVTSILLISIGTSFVSSLFYGEKTIDNNAPPNGEVYALDGNLKKNCNNEIFNRLFSGIDNDTGLYLNNLLLHVDGSEVNSYYSASAEYDLWHYPLVSGKYFTADDVKNGNKVVLIGSSLDEYSYKKNNEKYIKIEEEEYRVVGTIGFANQKSRWDGRIIMPCTSLPKNYFEEFNDNKYLGISFIMYSNLGDYSKSEEFMKSQGKSILKDFSFEDLGQIQSNSDQVLSLAAENPDKILLIAAIGYLVTLVFAINITIFWIEKRKYEISVRKAFGFTNGSIMKMIFIEMIGFAIISFVIAIIMQFVLSVVVGSIANYTLQLYLPNLVIGLVVVLVTALVTTLIPVIKAIKVEPAEALKAKEG
jgi:putative ABC transport system permease protein